MASIGRRGRQLLSFLYVVVRFLLETLIVRSRVLIFGRRHLKKVLAEYIDHYNHARPHQGIEQRRPCEPADMIPLPTGRVERRDRLGGVLHEYSRAAA